MPRLSGIELIVALREAVPGTRDRRLHRRRRRALARDVLDAGAVALLLKEAPLADLVRALEAVLTGDSYLDPALHRRRPHAAQLTPRELDVLRLLAEGLPHEEIGRRLGISVRDGAHTSPQGIGPARRHDPHAGGRDRAAPGRLDR